MSKTKNPLIQKVVSTRVTIIPNLKKLIALMKQKGINKAELARRVDLTSVYIGELTRGKKTTTKITIDKIYHVLSGDKFNERT